MKWQDWVNIDLEDADLHCDIRKLPLPDDHADAAAAIHVLEHFHAFEAHDLLVEWRRVLRPGGKLILELPCMDKVLNHLYQCMKLKAPISPSMSWFVFWGDPKYCDPYMVHKWGYTKEMLKQALEGAGFRDVAFEEPRYHFPMRDMRAVAWK